MNRSNAIQIGQLNPRTVWRRAISLIVIFSCGSCYGQESPDIQTLPRENSSNSSIPAVDSGDENIIDEINAIRSRLGGGVASQLKGLLPNSTAGSGTADNGVFSSQQMQQEFEAELRKLAAIQETDTVPLRRFAATAMPPRPLSRNNSRRPVNAIHAGQPSVCVCLRRAARNLELAAAELEEADRFGQADELRETARQLWIEARNQTRSNQPAGSADSPAATR